jgi:hypothetical protein
MKPGQECRHPLLTIEYLENEKGSIELEICCRCRKFITTRCEHKKNTWTYTRNQADPEEQALLCNLCGADGT